MPSGTAGRDARCATGRTDATNGRTRSRRRCARSDAPAPAAWRSVERVRAERGRRSDGSGRQLPGREQRRPSEPAATQTRAAAEWRTVSGADSIAGTGSAGGGDASATGVTGSGAESGTLAAVGSSIRAGRLGHDDRRRGLRFRDRRRVGRGDGSGSTGAVGAAGAVGAGGSAATSARREPPRELVVAAAGGSTGAVAGAGAGTAAGAGAGTGQPAQAQPQAPARPPEQRAGSSNRRRRRREPDHRQERERVEIPLRVGRGADPEMDVRDVDLRRPARTDRADHRALPHRRAARDRDRAEMRQRDREPVGGVDRDRLAARRNRPREAHRPRGGRAHRRARGRADVDPAVLAARVRVRVVEREPLDDRAVHGPGPRSRGGHPEDEQQDKRSEQPQ